MSGERRKDHWFFGFLFFVPDSNGNIRFLKTDFIPSYNVMIRKYICEFGKLVHISVNVVYVAIVYELLQGLFYYKISI